MGGLGFHLLCVILWPLKALASSHSGGIKDGGGGLGIGGAEKREQREGRGGAEGQL